jgi:hypothetical protein
VVGIATVADGPDMLPSDPRVAFLLDEYRTALQRGGSPDRDTVLARNPDIASLLAACLDGLDFLHRAVTMAAASGPLAETLLGDFRKPSKGADERDRG